MFCSFGWRKSLQNQVSFVVLATLWGGAFVAIEAGLRDLPPLLFAAVRYDLAAVGVLAYAVLAGPWLPRGRADLAAIAVSGVFVIGGHHALLYLGQGSVPGPIASAVVALSPVLTALVAAGLLTDERLSRTGLAGVAVGFAGVVVVAAPWSAAGAPPAGVALVFGATVSFAVGSVLLRRVRPTLPLRAVQGWGMVLGAALLHGGSLLRAEPQTLALTPRATAALAFLVLGPGVLAFLLYTRMLETVGATETTLVAYAEPVAAAALSWVVFGYLPGTAAVGGFALVLAGFTLYKWEAVRRVAGRARSGVAA